MYEVQNGKFFKVGRVCVSYQHFEVALILLGIPLSLDRAYGSPSTDGQCQPANICNFASHDRGDKARGPCDLCVSAHRPNQKFYGWLTPPTRPIFSYGGQGVGKHGLNSTEVLRHAVVHMEGRGPSLVPAENDWKKKGKISTDDAFTVHPSVGASLHAASRIRFDQPYTVRFNLPVLDLGIVLREHRSRLQDRYMDAQRARN